MSNRKAYNRIRGLRPLFYKLLKVLTTKNKAKQKQNNKKNNKIVPAILPPINLLTV